MTLLDRLRKLAADPEESLFFFEQAARTLIAVVEAAKEIKKQYPYLDDEAVSNLCAALAALDHPMEDA